MNASEIAERSGRSRSTASASWLTASGAREISLGPSLAPLNSPLWSWSSVSNWFSQSHEGISETQLIAEFVAMLNGKLDAREHQRRLNEIADAGMAAAAALQKAPSQRRLMVGRRRKPSASVSKVVIAAYSRSHKFDLRV